MQQSGVKSVEVGAILHKYTYIIHLHIRNTYGDMNITENNDKFEVRTTTEVRKWVNKTGHDDKNLTAIIELSK